MEFTLVLLTILFTIFYPQRVFSDFQSNSSNLIQFNSTMGSETEENLDKCFEVVSDVVQKAGDVNYHHFFPLPI